MILALGGDICAGARVNSAWPERLHRHIGQPVLNGGLSGGRLVDIGRRLHRFARVRVNVIVIQPGPVDAKNGGPPPAEWLAILEHLLEGCAYFWPNAEVFICTPHAIGRDGPRGYNRAARRWVKNVCVGVENVAHDHGCGLVRLDDAPLPPDGVFPDPKGHEWIAIKVAATVAPGRPVAAQGLSGEAEGV